MEEKYDIFISYRKSISGDKPEMLQQMLEFNGYKHRVSFDKDNLHGLFNVELLRRIDSCKDFLILVLPNTFSDCNPANLKQINFYKYLQTLSIDSFIAEMKRLDCLSKEELAEVLNWEGNVNTAHIDYVRIELGRALMRQERDEKVNIIPITIYRSEKYSFSNLYLPSDISKIKDFQAVFFSDSEEARFKDILLELKKHIISKSQRSVLKVIVELIVTIIIIVSTLLLINVINYTHQCDKAFRLCRTEVDFEKFINEYPNTDNAKFAKDSLEKMNLLKNNGIVYVNNTRDVEVEEKETMNVIWNSEISLLQLTAITDIFDRMMFIHASDKTFLMGIDEYFPYDKPSHQVTLTKDFYICQFEITRQWWYAIIENLSITESPNMPITNISWYEAVNFCQSLHELTGINFSLPTEAQWEYAALGEGAHCYSGSNNADEVAWFEENSNGNLHPVGQKNCNGINFQLYDMSGNAAEWCLDMMSFYTNESKIDPHIYFDNSNSKVITRGGSVNTPKDYLNVRHRDPQDPTIANDNVGFRIIFTINR